MKRFFTNPTCLTLVLWSLFLMMTGTASAQTIKYVTEAGAGTSDGSSWGNAAPGAQLQNLIDAAGANYDNNNITTQIWITTGTYLPTNNPVFGSADNRDKTFLLKNGVALYGGFAGTESNLADRNIAANQTILSGDLGTLNDNSDNAYHVLVAVDIITTGLDGFIIENGNAIGNAAVLISGASIEPYYGGGMFNYNSSPQIINNIFRNNSGSAIYNNNGAQPFITSSTFNNNTSINGGGAIQNDQASLVIKNSTFINNEVVTNNNGGAIYNQNSSSTSISNSVFIGNNTPGAGGAINNTANSNLTLTNNTFVGNTASIGGAIWNINSSTLVMNNSILYSNTSNGAVVNSIDGNSMSTVNYSLVQGGYAGTGNIDADPLFTDAANGDMTLTACSPAVNTGSNNDIATDLAGNPRIFGAGIVDMGAYELQANPTDLTISTNAALASGIINTPYEVTLSAGGCTGTVSFALTAGSTLPAGLSLASDGKLSGTPTNGGDFTFNITATQNGKTTIKAFTLTIALPILGANNVIYIKQNGAGNFSGSSWTNAATEVADALEAARIQNANANANDNITQVWVAAGTYSPTHNPVAGSMDNREKTFLMVNNVALYGGFAGTESNLSERNIAANQTILSGDLGTLNDNSDNAYHVVVSVNNDATAVLDGFIIEKGNADVNNNSSISGQTIYSAGGGGMFNSMSSPSLFNITFTQNNGLYGGGLYNDIQSSPIISNALFTANAAIFNINLGAGGLGGAMYNYDQSSPIITNTTFSANSADQGAGIYNDGQSSPNIRAGRFSGNTSQYGGAIYNYNQSSPSITNVTFNANSAIINNGSGGIGGAIYNDIQSSPVIANSTFSGNITDLSGGAFFNDNSAPVITNSVLYGNAANGVVNNIDGNSASVTYSLVQGGYAGTGNLDADPLFENAATGDLRLKPGSPAIDAGDDASIPMGISADISGKPRILGIQVDMGAYESNPVPTGDANGIIYVKQNGAGNFSGDSWANAAAEVGDALKAAESNAAITQVWVAAGTYYPAHNPVAGSMDNRDKTFLLVNNVALYGGFAGTESNLSERVIANNPTILSGDLGNPGVNTDNAYHVLVSVGSTSPTVLDGFIVEKGNANGNGFPNISGVSIFRVAGGGMFNKGSSPTIINSTFRDNLTDGAGGGGGIFNTDQSSPIIANSIFKGNFGGLGGAIYNSLSFPVIVNSTFNGNTSSLSAGIIFNTDQSSPIITNSILYGNTGEIFNDNGGSATVTYSLVQGGYAGTGNLDADPLFTNAANGDMSLTACSPAVNAGDNNAVTNIATDLAGNARTFGDKVDMGAYELQSAQTPLTFSPASLSNVVVNTIYAVNLSVGGCTGTTAFALSAGALPGGLSLAADGQLSGTATIQGDFSFTVTASQNGRTVSKEYSLTIAPAPSDNADLFALTISSGSLSPTFNAAIQTYAASVGNEVTSITVTPVAADTGASVNVNATPVTVGDPFVTVSLPEGLVTPVIIVVTAANGATKTYTLDVTRPAVNATDQTITFNALTAKTYGDDPFELGPISSTAGLTVAYTAEDAGVVSIEGNIATILKAGTTIIKANQQGDANTNPAPEVSQGLTINQAPLIIAAANKTKVAGAGNPLPEFTATYTGFVYGQDSGVLSTQPVFGTTPVAMADSPAGDYTITVDGAAAANYTITYTPGTLTITPAPVLSGNADLSKLQLSQGVPLNEAFNANTLTYTANMPLDNIKVIPTVADATATVTVNGNPVTSGAQSGSISLSPGTITSISIVVTAQDNTTKTYTLNVTRPASDAADQTIAFNALPVKTYGDVAFVLGPLNSSAGLPVTYTAADPAIVSITGNTATILKAGTTQIMALQVGNVNTNIVQVTQTLTVNKALLTITAANQSKTYGAPFTFTGAEFTATGLVTGATDAVSAATISSTGSDAAVQVNGSPYPILISAATGTGLTNYDITYVPGGLTVNPAPLSITAANKTKVAGDANPALTADYTGFVLSDNSSNALSTQATLNTTATTASPAGDYVITVGGAQAANYTITHINGTLTVTPGAVLSGNADLGNLAVSSGTLNPVFAAGTLAYTTSVANSATSINVTPAVAQANATVTVNGTTVTSGSASGAINLNVGNNTINTVVTAQDGTIKTYTLTVTRAAALSSNADLGNLAVSSGTLNPVFAAGTLAYTISVANSVTSINVTPTVAQANATVTVNGTTVTSGSASGAINLNVGNNTINTVVTAQDGTIKTYTLTVTRATALSSNADLGNLAVSSGTLNPVFAAGTLAYTASVANGISSINVTPTLAQANASVQVNGTTVISGTASGAIALNVGNNTINTVVTAQDGTIKTYTLTVTRAATTAAVAINIMSPNGDGVNDKFVISNIGQYPNNKLTIVDIAGRPIFTKTNYDDSFDGRLNSLPLVSGTYFWILESPGKETLKGFITIVNSNSN